MEYEKFISMRKEGKIKAGVDTSDALKLIDALPKNYQYAHHFWNWIWLLSIPGFILVSVFYIWWVGLLLLFTITPMTYRAIRKSAAQFVLEYIMEDKEFYTKLVENNLIEFVET